MNESIKIQHFTFSIKDYFNHTIDFKTLNTEYGSLIATLNSQEYKNILENIWSNLVSIENKEIENDSIEKQVIKLTEKAIAASNTYLMSISKKLTEQESRQNVSTLERMVIAGATTNTNLNHTIKYMFSNLKQDIRLKDDFINYIDRALQNTSKDIKRLKNTPFAMLPIQSKRANETIKQLSEKYIFNEENIIKLKESSSNSANDLLVTINKSNIDNVNVDNKQIVKLMSLAFLILIVISLIVILLNGSTSIIIGKFIKRFTIYISEIGSGNFGINIEQNLINRSDEFGIITRAFKDTMDKISSTLEQINLEALAMSEIGSQLSSSSQQISQGANEQASSIEEVSSSMEEMMANIEQNSENALKTEDISKNSAAGVEKVGNSAQESLSSVKNIASKITIVNDIAFQTNLLALNAAVEAARAGEHGKGFAVVASEVRKLAERSKIAADEIDKLSKSSVNVTEDAGELMQNIIPEILKTSQLIQEIASSSNEQRSGAEQINNAMQQLNSITQQNASAAEELASSAQELANRGEELKRTLNFFRTNNNGKTFERKKLITKESLVKNTMKKESTKTTTRQMENSINLVNNGSDKDFESF